MKSNLTPRLLVTGMLLINTAAFAKPGDKAPKEKIKYIDKSNMDLTVKPGNNFYQYANGNWVKNNPVPASKTRWGSFDELREESSKRLQILLEDAAKNTGRDRKTQVIGDFYTSGMDSAVIEAKGYQPIKADLDRLNTISSGADVLREITYMRVNGAGGALFGMGIGPDRKKRNEIYAFGESGWHFFTRQGLLPER